VAGSEGNYDEHKLQPLLAEIKAKKPEETAEVSFSGEHSLLEPGRDGPVFLNK